jgi:large conductance mechanosensitive channel
MWSEFKEFLFKANVLALALAFILGVALAAVVNSLVKDIMMPPVGLLLGGVDFNNLFIDLSGKHPASLKAAQDAGLATLNYGVFINTVITFIIVAFVVFLIARSFIPKGPAMKTCPFCGEEILASAQRCKFCTSNLAGEASPAIPLRSPR